MNQPVSRVLELFAGIGGLSAALGSGWIEAAIDINTDAATVYRANFSTPYFCREIDSLSDEQFRAWQAEVWWFSPPCQPYSTRGLQRKDTDRRAFALERVMRALAVCQPAGLAMENVLGFAHSGAYQQLIDWLTRKGYRWQTIKLCPSQLGWPNRRPRFYLIASRNDLKPWSRLQKSSRPLKDFIDPLIPSDETQHLWIRQADAQRYWSALDRIPIGLGRTTACFAASYGKTWLQAGSYLETEHGLRRFSPREVARLLGFPDDYRLPPLCDSFEKSDRKLWKLLGNSLSIPCVRYVMSHLGFTADAVHPRGCSAEWIA